MKYLLSLITVISILSGQLAADEYVIEQVNITAEIKADGAIQFLEERIYSFDGEFTWATYTLPKRGFTELTNISIRDENREYLHENSEEPGTFTITTNPEEINFQWFYQAVDETKTFTISYTLHDALAVGHTWTEFFWNFISDRWKEPTEHARIQMEIPDIISEDSLHIWLRTDVTSADVNISTSGYIVTANDIGDDDNLKVRFLFPSSVLQNIQVTAPELSLESAREEEIAYQEELTQQSVIYARRAGAATYLTVIISILSAGVWLFLYIRRGRSHSVEGIPKYLYDTPTDDKPAVIGWLIQHRSLNGSHMIATIFDLARQSFFTIHQEESEKSSFFQKKEYRFRIEKNLHVTPEEMAQLTPWEKDLYDFIVDSMEDTGIYLDKLTDQRSAMGKWFPEWSKMVRNEAKSRNWMDQTSIKTAWSNFALQLVLFLSGIFITIWSENPFGLVGVFTAFTFGILSLIIVRRSTEGEKKYQQWYALKRSMEKMPDHRFQQDHLDLLFIYVIAFGLSEKKLKRWLEHTDFQTQQMSWVVFLPAVTSPSAVASSVSMMAGTGLTTVSSVAGGAGASAGAAGGGAGGGAG